MANNGSGLGYTLKTVTKLGWWNLVSCNFSKAFGERSLVKINLSLDNGRHNKSLDVRAKQLLFKILSF